MSVLLKRIVKILEMTLLMICGICFLSILITGIRTGKPSIFGFRPFFVMTGSMEPTIRAHSLVVAVPVYPDEVRTGDIVTYTREAADTLGGQIRIPFTVIHRVRGIRDDLLIFQGDNEVEPDPPVRAEQIGYRVVWIGKGLSFIWTRGIAERGDLLRFAVLWQKSVVFVIAR